MGKKGRKRSWNTWRNSSIEVHGLYFLFDYLLTNLFLPSLSWIHSGIGQNLQTSSTSQKKLFKDWLPIWIATDLFTLCPCNKLKKLPSKWRSMSGFVVKVCHAKDIPLNTRISLRLCRIRWQGETFQIDDYEFKVSFCGWKSGHLVALDQQKWQPPLIRKLNRKRILRK